MRRSHGHSFFIIAALIVVPWQNAIAATSSERPHSTPQQVFDGMRHSFRAEKAKGLHVRYQFNLKGPNGGNWFIDVNDGKFRMNRGNIVNPNCTFVASDDDWVALSNGTLNGPWAFLSGRLKILGDRAFAKKLNEIFP